MKPSTLFKNIFLGEYVELIAQISNDERTNMMQLQGWLLDLDNEWYFLGSSPNEVTDCIRHADVKHILIVKPSNPAMDLLNKVPVTRAEDGN